MRSVLVHRFGQRPGAWAPLSPEWDRVTREVLTAAGGAAAPQPKADPICGAKVWHGRPLVCELPSGHSGAHQYTIAKGPEA